MPDFLLEIGCEEIPARMIDAGSAELRERISKLLERERLTPSDQISSLDTPRRLGLIADLRRAITIGELTLYYQPKVNLGTGSVSCVEALVRWHHPTRGILLPTEFIPLAEETGVIRPLTDWMLENALEQLQRADRG